MTKLAIITTHPIQYNAPLFKLLDQRSNIQIKVFYTWSQSEKKVYDPKFGKEIKWDIPVLVGYDYKFVNNTSKKPSSATFCGIINPTLNKEIKLWKADKILIFGWNHKSHFKAMRYFKNKIPVIFRGDSHLLDEYKDFKTLLRRIFLKFVYKYIDFALYVGQNNKKYYLKHGLKEKQLIFAPHAIDNNRFFDENNYYSKKAENWRLKLGYKKEDIIFMFVGKYEKKKNPLLLITAAKELPDFQFLFIGNGELESEMKRKASDISNVTFLDFQNQTQMPVVYRLGNIYVLPSQGPGETWGLGVNEAMASGKAIIVSDKVGCAIDLVKNNKNGYIFESNNLTDIKNKIIKTANKNKEYGNYSKIIIINWCFENIACQLENT